MAALIAARRGQFDVNEETREEAKERRRLQRIAADLKKQREADEAKEALAAAQRAEAEAVKEEQEATEAEAKALQEEHEAEEARDDLRKEEEDVLRVEAEVLTLEKRLADGEDVATELEARRQTLQKEKQEVDEARGKLEKELSEARDAKETAAKEKTEALEARAKAKTAAEIAYKEMREAEAAVFEAAQQSWIMQRAEAHEPLIEEDMLYRVLFFPLKSKLQKDRDAILTKSAKRKIDNLINTIHRQWCVYQPLISICTTAKQHMCCLCTSRSAIVSLTHVCRVTVCSEYMQEDMEFLMQCFEYLDENEDELLTEDEIKIWLTILNHGDEPTPDELEDCIDTLGTCCPQALPFTNNASLPTIISWVACQLCALGPASFSRANCTPLEPGLSTDEYRELLGADPTEGVLEKEDFLLVTFDYYLALGKTYMRCLFTDLLLS